MPFQLEACFSVSTANEKAGVNHNERKPTPKEKEKGKDREKEISTFHTAWA